MAGNQKTVELVKRLLHEINGNTTVPRATTLADLEAIQEELEMLLSSLKDDE